jgi:hypothetical protein
MNNVNESSFNAAEVFGLLSRYRRLVITGAVSGLILSMTAAYTLPRKYKSHFTLTIYAKYFQNALIHDFMPEVSDPGEMRSERQSLIRQSLSPEFLDSLSQKYALASWGNGAPAHPGAFQSAVRALKKVVARAGVYRPAKKEATADAAREELLARIQIFDLNNTTFHVSFIASDPEVSLQVTRDIYAQVIRNLLDTHTNNLVNIRNAIRNRVESLGASLVSTIPDPHAAIRPQLVNDELADIRSQIRALSSQYTEDHPLMKELRDRARTLRRWQENSSFNETSASSSQENAFGGEQSLPAAKDIYGDLMKKLNYLNITLEADRTHQADYFATVESPIYPESPIWPKKGLLALWGLSLGFVGALSIAALREYFKRTTLHAEGLSVQTGIPLLGIFPAIPWNGAIKAEIID